MVRTQLRFLNISTILHFIIHSIVLQMEGLRVFYRPTEDSASLRSSMTCL